MADGRDPPKSDNPRYKALIDGKATTYYIARRYFQLLPDEWDKLPWHITVAYIQGLEDQGVFKSSGASTNPGNPGPGPKSVSVDYTDAIPLPKGFKTRRAG